MSRESYTKGFCKAAEAMGIKPEALCKYAADSEGEGAKPWLELLGAGGTEAAARYVGKNGAKIRKALEEAVGKAKGKVRQGADTIADRIIGIKGNDPFNDNLKRFADELKRSGGPGKLPTSLKERLSWAIRDLPGNASKAVNKAKGAVGKKLEGIMGDLNAARLNVSQTPAEALSGLSLGERIKGKIGDMALKGQVLKSKLPGKARMARLGGGALAAGLGLDAIRRLGKEQLAASRLRDALA